MGGCHVVLCRVTQVLCCYEEGRTTKNSARVGRKAVLCSDGGCAAIADVSVRSDQRTVDDNNRAKNVDQRVSRESEP